MKNKKIFLVIAIVVIAIIVAVFMLNGGKKTKTLDLATLNTTLSEKAPFNEMATMDITPTELTSILEVDPDDVVSVVGKMPLMNVHASMYLVVEAKEGSVDVVKEKVEKYGQAQEEQWEKYLPAQYELVKARKNGVVGNYVYLVISETAEELEKLIIK